MQLATATIQAATEDGRRAYDVVAITPGRGNGHMFSAEVLRRSVEKGLWNAAPVHVDHAGRMDAGRPGGRSVRDLVGVFCDPQVTTEGAITGVLRVYRNASWLCDLVDDVLASRAAGEPTPRFGLSVDCTIERKGDEVVDIIAVHGVDVVNNPARGGHFCGFEDEEEVQMGESNKQETVRERIRTGIEEGAEAEAASAQQERTPMAAAAMAGASAGPGEAAAGGRSAEDLWEEYVKARLQLAGLNASQGELVRGMVDKKGVHTADELNEAIQKVKRATLGSVRNLGLVQVKDQVDRIQLAVDRLVGCTMADSDLNGVPRLSGIRELYLMFTGDYDMYGRIYRDRAQLANLTTTSMSSVVKNALNKRLLEVWEMLPQWWKPIVHEEDFATMNDVTWITMGGFGDLPTVSEGAAYVEQASPSDIEETSSFLKKGGYVGLTMEMIDRDDVSAVRAIPRKLALAANRTLASGVSEVFTANSGVGPTLDQDATALFDAAGHGNLGTTALSFTEWTAVVTAMFEQTEPVSGKPMGIRPKYCLVPIELEETALRMFRFPEFIGYGGGTNTEAGNTNIRYNQAQVIVVPDWTDANNWAAVADPRMFPGICIGYRFGRAPELFVAGDPLMGSMFTNDTMRIKARFVYTIGIGEYRAMYKENV